MKKYIAEFLGTLWLVLGGCGSAVLAANIASSATAAATDKIPEMSFGFNIGLGYFGVALAFGLTVLTGAYALGHISGGHFNPAVSFGLFAAKRFPSSELLPYIIAQVAGAIVAAIIILIIANGQPGFILANPTPLATNGYDIHSPHGYGLWACFVSELVMTFFFLLIILGITDKRAPAGFAPLAIGFALTLIHLISIPVTNTSVNPARSTGPALLVGFNGNWELFGQLWLFWFAPILGAVLAGLLYYSVFDETREEKSARIAAEQRVVEY